MQAVDSTCLLKTSNASRRRQASVRIRARGVDADSWTCSDDTEQSRRIEDLSASFADVCASREAPFIDLFAPTLAPSVWMAEISASDGAHPLSGGYTVLAKLVISGFLDWLFLLA